MSLPPRGICKEPELQGLHFQTTEYQPGSCTVALQAHTGSIGEAFFFVRGSVPQKEHFSCPSLASTTSVFTKECQEYQMHCPSWSCFLHLNLATSQKAAATLCSLGLFGHSRCRDPNLPLGWSKEGFVWRDSWHHRHRGFIDEELSFTLPKVCCLCSTRRAIKTVPAAFSTSWKGNKAAKWVLRSRTAITSIEKKKKVLFFLCHVEAAFPLHTFLGADLWLENRKSGLTNLAGKAQAVRDHGTAVSPTLCVHEVATYLDLGKKTKQNSPLTYPNCGPN